MTIDEFRASLSAADPPAVPAALRALWHDARGDWNAAHTVAQAIDGPTGARVHAYLHRKEGDLANAEYWYRHAEQPVATDSLTAEWERLVAELLKS
jgi:hypothetical protein